MKSLGILSLLLINLLLLAPAGHAQLADEKLKPGEDSDKPSTEYDLTDQARFESQTYVHQGLSQRQMDEECAKLKDPGACQGRGKTKFLGIDSSIIQMIARVYSMFGGMMSMSGGGGMDFEAPAPAEGETTAGESEAPSEDGEGGKKDYCSMIPMAGEMVAMFAQQTGDQVLASQPVTQDTPQKELLYKASRSHTNRSKSAKIQGTVWGATAACYAAYIASGSIAIDWKVIAKAGGAAFLGVFWFSEAKQQEKYAEEVKKIADALPGRGDCNPHTQVNCYCAQPETQYDPTYCLPQLHKKAVANDSFRVPCVDQNLNADAQCDCISREACFDKEFFSDISAPGFVQFAKSSAGKDFRNLTRGELSNGRLSSLSNSNSAKSKKLLGDLASKVDDNNPLSKSQLSVSDDFEKYGVPKPLARLLASRPITAAGRKKVAGIQSGLSESRSRFANVSRSGGSNVMRFSSGLGKVGPGNKNSGPNYNSMLNKFKKGKGGKVSSKTLKFADRAQKQAQITRNKDKPIFEIISRRYQVSGWRRLEIE